MVTTDFSSYVALSIRHLLTWVLHTFHSSGFEECSSRLVIYLSRFMSPDFKNTKFISLFPLHEV
jgi:hypothetical protein